MTRSGYRQVTESLEQLNREIRRLRGREGFLGGRGQVAKLYRKNAEVLEKKRERLFGVRRRK